MPIPLDELNRALIPRVLTPGTTVAELLYLFAEQPEPRRCYAVVRVGRDEYDVLALDDLGDPVARRRESILTLALSALPGLLKPAAPVRYDKIGADAARRAQAATPRRRLVVLDADGVVLGVMASTNLGVPKGMEDPLALIGLERPSKVHTGLLEPPPAPPGVEPDVLEPEPSPAPGYGPPPPGQYGPPQPAPGQYGPPPAPAHLNTQFKGLGPNQPLTVGQRVSLIVWVGAPTTTNLSQSSRPFTFDFEDATTPVAFIVYVDADPEGWEISAVQPTMLVAPPGTTTQAAVFRVTARLPGRDKLHISVERADTGAAVQHVWLPVVVAAADALVVPAPAAEPRAEVLMPLDGGGIARPGVEITIQPGVESFRIGVRADLPNAQIRDSYSVPVSSQAVQNATLRLRQELRKIVFYQEGQGEQARFPFADLNTLTVEAATARQAILPLADAAKRVWNLIFNPPRAPEGLKKLADDLRATPPGSTFRVVLESQDFIVPWALLYDKPGPVSAETLEWNGFWGYRYIVDALPPGRYPPPAIDDAPLQIQLLFNDDWRLQRFTEVQERFVRDELTAIQASVARGDAAVRAALMRESDAALIYFYCHGDRKSGAETVEAPYRAAARRARGDDQPSLAQLADDSALYFSPAMLLRLADLRDLPVAALPHRPLVFLNACEGASQEAFYYDGFMPFFIEQRGARGFIGAEVKAPQLLGHDFAIAFLRAFAEGRPIGEILWRLRRYYLDTHHTILAFNYSLYCLSDVHLARPPLPVEG
jgi:hypothetical protein